MEGGYVCNGLETNLAQKKKEKLLKEV